MTIDMGHLIWLAILWGLCAAMVGVVYTVVLPGEDIPFLRAWYGWLNAWHERGGWRMVVASPLGACTKCFSGQLAFWSSSMLFPWLLWGPSIALHVISACSAVLFAVLIAHVYRWISNRI